MNIEDDINMILTKCEYVYSLYLLYESLSLFYRHVVSVNKYTPCISRLITVMPSQISISYDYNYYIIVVTKTKMSLMTVMMINYVWSSL